MSIDVISVYVDAVLLAWLKCNVATITIIFIKGLSCPSLYVSHVDYLMASYMLIL